MTHEGLILCRNDHEIIFCIFFCFFLSLKDEHEKDLINAKQPVDENIHFFQKIDKKVILKH